MDYYVEETHERTINHLPLSKILPLIRVAEKLTGRKFNRAKNVNYLVRYVNRAINMN